MLSTSGKCLSVSVVVLALALTGCDNVPLRGDFEVGFDGERLLLVSCQDASVTEVSVSEYIRKPGESSSQRVWEASGERSLAEKDPLIVGGENRGLINGLVRDVTPGPGTQYHVLFNDMPDRVSSARFVWPDGGVAPGRWLSTDGDLHAGPCEAAGE